MFLTTVDEGGVPFDVKPQSVFNRLRQQLYQRELFSVIAIELESYLLDRQRDAEGYLQPPCAPDTDDRNTQSQAYSADNLNHFVDVLNDIGELAQLQLIPADGAAAKTSSGQFEINLHCTDNVLEACDDILVLKCLVRLMAEKHKTHVTFMVKPYEEHAGNGVYTYISMQDNRGENVLSDVEDGDSPLLEKMLVGVIDLMPSPVALLVPNVSSYRRLQPGVYVPAQASWGRNSHIVTLCIPCGDRYNHYMKYHVAGADVNPYLVMAAIFAGILYGLGNELLPQEEAEGNGLEQDGLPFPTRQSDALGESIESDHLRRYLGERSCHVYHTCKNDELLRFKRLIIGTEIEQVLEDAQYPSRGCLIDLSRVRPDIFWQSRHFPDAALWSAGGNGLPLTIKTVARK